MPSPLAHRLIVNEVELALFEWPGDEPAVFLAHATGFHARCWDRVIAYLPGRRCLALDMRGHGRSEKPPPPYEWRMFGEDVAEVARTMGMTGAIGVGHSKGGHAVTLAAALEPGKFAALLLVDPVILRPEAYGTSPVGEHFAARRRNEWKSPQEMYERFKERLPFSRWDDGVLRDYCGYGLLPAPSGEGYVLACPPSVEAAVYAGSAGTNIYAEIQALEIPVRILRAAPRANPDSADMSGSPTNPELARWFQRGEDVLLPDHTHFIPMEAPGFVAAQVSELLQR